MDLHGHGVQGSTITSGSPQLGSSFSGWTGAVVDLSRGYPDFLGGATITTRRWRSAPENPVDLGG